MKKKLKKGISGIMRIRNEKCFIENCVHSCISALDELIIVYNDCTDGSEEIIKQIQLEFPEKVRTFEYPYKVFGVGLNKEEYDYAKSLPDDSPHLLCNYYNFALDKVSYEYAIKIDADQIYIPEIFNEYCNLCRIEERKKWNIKIALGYLFQRYLSAYRFISIYTERVIPIMPKWLAQKAAGVYKKYAIYLFKKNKACLSLSGFNVLHEKKETYISLGHKSETFNTLPPFNGEGDHVIFKVSENTYYKPFDMMHYNIQRNTSHSIIEIFVHPYRIMPIGFAWTHINAERPEYYNEVIKVKQKYQNYFIKIESFFNLDYAEILKRSDSQVFSLYQRILFGFVYKAYGQDVKKYILENDNSKNK